MLQFIVMNITAVLAIFFGINMLDVSSREKKRIHKVCIISYLLMILFGSIAYKYAAVEFKKKHHRELTVMDYLNGGNSTKNFLKRIAKGFGVGVVFGMLDNGGLWFGMSALDPITPKGFLTKAGYGNVFSDTLSAFLSTFVGSIIAHHLPVDGETPIWANAAGTLFGTLFGLNFLKLVTGRN